MRCLQPNSSEVSVSLSAQSITYHTASYPISSSKYGVGSESGSNKTPLGRFQVSEKFGSGDPPFTIFKARKAIGLWAPDSQDLEEDRILSRILRLSGLNPSNHNTYGRYIYIHGTNNEQGIGKPHSIGCIRMKNIDIIKLYNSVPLGSIVQIYN